MIDPVCGMTVTPGTAAGAWERVGTTYYLSSVSCMEPFKGAPEDYIDMDPAQRHM